MTSEGADLATDMNIITYKNPETFKAVIKKKKKSASVLFFVLT